MWRWLAPLSAALTVFASGTAAYAQRASEDAMQTASDGFGLSIGAQSVGLYSQNSARGFSPSQAGNIRIEGLFIDPVGRIGTRITSGTTMRVGLAAQSYAFPAPTGIADIRLRLPSSEPVYSLNLAYQSPYGMSSPSSSFDASIPLIPDILGVVGGVGWGRGVSEQGRASHFRGAAAVVRFTPNDDIVINPFFITVDLGARAANPSVFTAGVFVPERIDRSAFYGQDWAERVSYVDTGGLLGRFTLSPHWETRAGLFFSGQRAPTAFSILYRNTQPDGSATLDILNGPKQSARSYSGEVRAIGSYGSGKLTHVVHLSARGRDVNRWFGGAESRSFGAARIGVFTPIPEPAFNLGPRTQDEVRQTTLGAAYVGSWAGRVNMSVGLQKSFYRRSITAPAQATRSTTDEPWLPNATLAVSPSGRTIVFGSYTRGLEASGVAPENASNRGEVLPASITEQFDAGVSYQLSENLSLVADVFEITKPYFALNTQDLFARSGVTRHRGFELSLSGRPLPGLSIVGGMILMKPRILQSVSGAQGNVPPGRPSRTVRFNAQYGPTAWRGFAVNAAVNHRGPVYFDRLNTLKLPGLTTLNIGARYDFTVGGTALSLRGAVNNVANVFRWQVAGGSGRVSPNSGRQYIVRLVADFGPSPKPRVKPAEAPIGSSLQQPTPKFIPPPEQPEPRPAPPVMLAPPPRVSPPPPAPRPAPLPVPTSTASGGPVVQVGAMSSTTRAEQIWNEAVAVAPGLAVGKGRSVQEIEVNGSLLYRSAVTGFANRAEATAFCDRLKAAGKSCFVR